MCECKGGRPFDPTKPVQTRDGRPARIVCTDKKGKFPIVALVSDSNDREHACLYNASGKHGWDYDNDLVNVPEKHVRWVNFYKGTSRACTHLGKFEADRGATDGRIACVRVEFTEGDGLDG